MPTRTIRAIKPAESNNSALVMVSCAATKVPHIAPDIESPRRPATGTICAISTASSILVGLLLDMALSATIDGWQRSRAATSDVLGVMLLPALSKPPSSPDTANGVSRQQLIPTIRRQHSLR